jgi:FAD/FMN-containing dehydrogenase
MSSIQTLDGEPVAQSHAHPGLMQELQAGLGVGCLMHDEALRQRQTSDWSDAKHATPLLLVLPRTTVEVATILQLCHKHRQPVAIQGGLTGLAGGANPQPGEVAISLSRLNEIEELDIVGGTAIVQAGVTLQALQEAAAAHDMWFPLDLGARGSCHLGGNAATNAGGNRVLRFGMMRNLVLGLEAVLPDGTVLTMLDRMLKNNAGFDLKQLFIGSEGTLGIITRLSLSLVPRPGWRGSALCAVSDFTAALALLRHAKANVPGLSAFELMWQDYFEASAAARGASMPFEERFPLYILIECFAGSQPQGEAAFEAMLESAMKWGMVRNAILAQSESQAQQLWNYREGVSELLAQCKPCAAFDVSVAVQRMDELVAELRTRLGGAYPGQQHLFFGHLGDGNLHLISGPFRHQEQLEHAEELVYATVGRFQGSISAEHGIGTVKRPFLHHCRSAAEIRVMQQMKATLDPHSILNRGRIFAPIEGGRP